MDSNVAQAMHRLFTPGTPVSTVFSDATAELLHCGYQRPDHPCTTGQSFRAIHSQLPNYVAKAELTRFSVCLVVHSHFTCRLV